MHPAASVIFFTTASGAGYGMLALMGIFAAFGLMPADRGFGATALVIALGLVTAGLLSSTFHLGHPERAWRALTQWRSSWLSREGVLAILTYGPALLFGLGWVYFGSLDGIWALAGLAAAAMAMITVYSTSMIYASLKTIPEWHHKLVPPNYLMLGLATGAVWLVCVSALFGLLSQAIVIAALALVLISGAVKFMYWTSIDRQSPESDMGTATGLGPIGKVRQLEAPHSSDNWVMREMGYVVARKHAEKLRKIAAGLTFLLPALVLGVLAAGAHFAVLALLAAASVSGGIIVERWLFFAEAKHVVGHYYGRR